MPKINAKKTTEPVVAETSTPSSENAMVAATSTPLSVNAMVFEAYISNNNFADKNGIPLCPDCDGETPLKIFEYGNGLDALTSLTVTAISASGNSYVLPKEQRKKVYKCMIHNRFSVFEDAAIYVHDNQYIPEEFTFPVCGDCEKVTMHMISKEGETKGMLYYKCRCSKVLFLSKTNKRAHDLIQGMSDSYKQKEFRKPVVYTAKPYRAKPYHKPGAVVEPLPRIPRK